MYANYNGFCDPLKLIVGKKLVRLRGGLEKEAITDPPFGGQIAGISRIGFDFTAQLFNQSPEYVAFVAIICAPDFL